MNFSMFDNMVFDDQCHCSDKNDIRKNKCDIERFPTHTPIAMAYVPMQQWGPVYEEDKALTAGTIFPELDMPFDPEGGCHEQR